MSKQFTLIVGIIALSQTIYSFFGNENTADFLGLELNIWLYRLLWTTIAVGIFYGYFNKQKSKIENQ